jgi:effector-binding domain-containing protein
MSHECTLKERPVQHALVIRRTVPVAGLPDFFAYALPRIWNYLEAIGQQPSGPPFGAYHNRDMQALDVEAGFPVATHLAGSEEIHPTLIAGGEVVSTIHVGPYQTLDLAYHDLSRWIKGQGYAPSGPFYEFYLNDPATVPPDAIQTEVAVPVLPAG